MFALRTLAIMILAVAGCDKPNRVSIAPTTSSASSAGPTVLPAGDGIVLPHAENYVLDPLAPGVAPRVSVRRVSVLIDGETVDTVAAIEASGRPTRIDGIFNTLKAKREAWKSAHAGASFPGEVVFRFDETLPLVIVESAFQTAAFAGYPNASFAVRTAKREGRLVVDAAVPGPPNLDPSPPLPELTLHVDAKAADKFVLRWVRGLNIVSEVDVPRDLTELAAKIGREWKAQGSHIDPADRRLDQVILHVDDKAPYKDAIDVVNAINATQRDFITQSGRDRVAAFNTTLSIY